MGLHSVLWIGALLVGVLLVHVSSSSAAEKKGHFHFAEDGRVTLRDSQGNELPMNEAAAGCMGCGDCCCAKKNPWDPSCGGCKECWNDFGWECDSCSRLPPTPRQEEVEDIALRQRVNVTTRVSNNATNSVGAISCNCGDVIIDCSTDNSNNPVLNCVDNCVKGDLNCIHDCPVDCSTNICPNECSTTCPDQCQQSLLGPCSQNCSAADNVAACIQACINTNLPTCVAACTPTCVDTCTPLCAATCPITCAESTAGCVTACTNTEVLPITGGLARSFRARTSAYKEHSRRVSQRKY